MKDKIIHEWYLEHNDSSINSHKFYEVLIWQSANRYSVTRRFGRIGTNTKAKEVAVFSDFHSAQLKATSLVDSKTIKKSDPYKIIRDKRINALTVPGSSKQEAPEVEIVIKEVPDEQFWGGMALA